MHWRDAFWFHHHTKYFVFYAKTKREKKKMKYIFTLNTLHSRLLKCFPLGIAAKPIFQSHHVCWRHTLKSCHYPDQNWLYRYYDVYVTCCRVIAGWNLWHRNWCFVPKCVSTSSNAHWKWLLKMLRVVGWWVSKKDQG